MIYSTTNYIIFGAGNVCKTCVKEKFSFFVTLTGGKSAYVALVLFKHGQYIQRVSVNFSPVTIDCFGGSTCHLQIWEQ